MINDTEKSKPWERLEGETNQWFQRFNIYLTIGPNRTLEAAWREDIAQRLASDPRKMPKRPNRSWWENFHENRWKERAEAWDKHCSDGAMAIIEARWRNLAMAQTEVLGRLSEMGRNDIGQFFIMSERWTEKPIPIEEILKEEEITKRLPGGGTAKAMRYLVRKVSLNMPALTDPELSFRVKKFMDSPKYGVSIELHDAQSALINMGKHLKLFNEREERPLVSDEIFMLPADCVAPSFLDVYDDIKDHAHTEYMFHGGRGSTKSSFISLVIIWLIKNNPTMHGIALRQVGNTLRDSVYSQLEWAINELGLADEFKCTVSPLEIEYKPTGQKIYFRGADEPGKIKSIKPAFGYIGIAWFEELDQFHGPEAVRNIEQSAIRGGDLAYIFKSFNPPRTAANWANKYVQVPKANQLQHHSTYIELGGRIKWLGKPWVEEAEHLKQVNPRAYEHEYLGVANGTGGMVFENVLLRKITDEEIAQFDHVMHGLDWGYYPDPAHYARMHYDAARMTLYIFGELRRSKTSNRQLYDDLVAYGCRGDDVIIADSAEPKSVADFRGYASELYKKPDGETYTGPDCRGAEKGPESVKYSMKWLQSLATIVIDPERCPETSQEFLDYELEQDKDGNFISEYPDANNHAIDAVRYGANLIWRRRGQ
jgi:PBSX family phage terminase large subunit